MTADQQKPRLPVHEWLAVLCIFCLLVMLTLLSRLTTYETLPDELDDPHYVVDPNIEIFIEGAVEIPGRYHVKKGMTVEEVLALAKPQPDADLRRIKLDSKILRRRTIKIRKKM